MQVVFLLEVEEVKKILRYWGECLVPQINGMQKRIKLYAVNSWLKTTGVMDCCNKLQNMAENQRKAIVRYLVVRDILNKIDYRDRQILYIIFVKGKRLGSFRQKTGVSMSPQKLDSMCKKFASYAEYTDIEKYFKLKRSVNNV